MMTLITVICDGENVFEKLYVSRHRRDDVNQMNHSMRPTGLVSADREGGAWKTCTVLLVG